LKAPDEKLRKLKRAVKLRQNVDIEMEFPADCVTLIKTTDYTEAATCPTEI